MGILGSLFGWDQSMGAMNAVLASYLIEKANRAERQRIAKEVANIISSVQRKLFVNGHAPDGTLEAISKESRVIQMNFIALACDNLGIAPPVPNRTWARLKNPYQMEYQVDAERISAAVGVIGKTDKVVIVWPGNDAKVDFKKMHQEGELR